MAPVDRAQQTVVEQQLQNIIQDLYEIMVQVTNYDTTPRPTRDVLADQIKSLAASLQTLHTTASTTPLPSVPPELIHYVENGRNPDIYTREFVELVRRGNQTFNGKLNAFAGFRDMLARDIASAMPELRDDVDRIMEGAGLASPSAVGHGNVKTEDGLADVQMSAAGPENGSGGANAAS
ncbi:transcription factor subunit Med10 of mediator complex-domain-containing protein [Emericellopsis atlantica]|uniref:Mediator of RNA polymerase II transcription subunit 10 n=1 Tax=Emericellopsis atlantica TaxID=2614577 RepID=A0A9P7ZTA4_9HYPO|nr:transcription factor subunit Med10 of mediator complex-domain-containing protein [Emericellopsis atlantica]KAG9257238.1 transcription factor subunit Med10 of mediator complex-domain-containing protein [Emericellopsis atlantica]